MRIQEHIDKISWSLMDKGLMVLYGLVSLFQVKLINSTEEFALYFLLWQLYNWIFVVSDSIALQNIIQFGAIEKNRPRVNLYALIGHLIIGLGIPMLIFLFRGVFANVFNEPRLYELAGYLPFLALFTIPRNLSIKFLLRDSRFRDIFIVNLFYFGTMAVATFWYYLQNVHFDFILMIKILFTGVILSSAIGILLSRKQIIIGVQGDFNRKKMFEFSLPYFYYSMIHSFPKLLDSYILKAFGFSTSTIGVYGAVKILFRVFDEGANATYGLIYPVSVKLTSQNRIEELKAVMTKFVSFMLILIIPIVIALNLGLTDLIVHFFDNPKYIAAVDMFNLMVIASIAMPFGLLSVIITASGKPKITFKYVVISVLISFIGFGLAIITKNEFLMPMGIIFYHFTLGLLSFVYIKRNYGFPVKMMLRAINDSVAFIKSKIGKK